MVLSLCCVRVLCCRSVGVVRSFEREKKGDRRKYLVAASGAEALLRQDLCDFLLGKKVLYEFLLVESAGIFEKRVG